MAKRAFIPITDHNTGDICTAYYDVRFKPATVDYWTELTLLQPTEEGSPLQWGIVLEDLADDILYDYEITRHCCPEIAGPGQNSVAASGTFTSTP